MTISRIASILSLISLDAVKQSLFSAPYPTTSKFIPSLQTPRFLPSFALVCSVGAAHFGGARSHYLKKIQLFLMILVITVFVISNGLRILKLCIYYEIDKLQERVWTTELFPSVFFAFFGFIEKLSSCSLYLAFCLFVIAAFTCEGS